MVSRAIALALLLFLVLLVDRAITSWPTLLSAPRLHDDVLVFGSFGLLAGTGLGFVESLASSWRDDGRREVRVLLLALFVGVIAVLGPIFQVEYVRALIESRSIPRAFAMVELRFEHGAAKTWLHVGIEDAVSLALAISPPLAAGASIRVSRSRFGLGLALLAMAVTTVVFVLPLLLDRRAHAVLAWILLPVGVAAVRLGNKLEALCRYQR